MIFKMKHVTVHDLMFLQYLSTVSTFYMGSDYNFTDYNFRQTLDVLDKRLPEG